MRPTQIFILLALLPCLFSLAVGSIVINEVELDYLEDDVQVQWVELYNSGPNEADVSGWAVMSRDDSRKEFVPDGTVIPADGFYLINFGEKWLNNFGAVVVLVNDVDREMDRTIGLFDSQEDSCAWGRYPDGGSEWMFMESSPGETNSGVPCEEVESKALRFDMEGSVSGTGYVNLQDRAVGPDGGSVTSHEHGSGEYQSEESLRMDLNQIANTSSIQLRKNDLAMRYNRTFHQLPGNRTTIYDSKVAESSAITGSEDSGEQVSQGAQSTTYGTSISKDVLSRSDYGSIKLNLSSDSVGRSNVEYCSEEIKLAEEYLGAFEIEESISLGGYQRRVNSSGESSGYVDVYKKVKRDYSTYERGSGSYRAEELIEAGDSAKKDVSLIFRPAGYAYSPSTNVNRTHKWDEGLSLNTSNGLYAKESYTSLERMEKDVVVNWPNQLKTSSNFTGKASLKSVFRPDNNTTDLAFIEDEYVGDYKIERKFTVLPEYTTPHMSVYKQGYVDPDRCDVLRFSVTVVNDGNRTFAPIYVRDTFPSGTRFMGSSIEPIELTRSYGNWSIASLGSGESATIDMQFQVITRRDNYTNRARANTIYVYPSRGTFRERNLRVSNSTTLEVDWKGCAPEKMPLDFTATVSPDNERIVSYRLILNNSAGYNMSANITALLPEGMSFINSTTPTLENQSGVIKWNIKKLDEGRRRTISFMALAERDGLFVTDARVYGNSTEGNDSISASTSTIIIVGKAPRATNIETLQSTQWLPCEDSSLYQSLAKLEATTSSKELKCCY